MAFTKGQVDRFGRPIPASPGIQVLINADGSEVQQRNRLILPASMVVSDSPDNDASSIALDAGPALIAAGYSLPISVHNAAYSGTVITSNTWVADLFRRIEVHLKNDTGNTTSIMLALAGITAGTYYTSGLAIAAATNQSYSAQNGWKIDTSSAGGVNASVDANIACKNRGAEKKITGISAQDTGQGFVFTGTCLDPTNPATGLVITFSTACTGWLEVIGYK